MTDPQASNPIDDIYRKTFENLPETPAGNGWDAPSDRVWQQIQGNITPPKKTWGVRALLLMAGLALLITAAIYWLSKPSEPANALPEVPEMAPIQQPVVTPSAVATPAMPEISPDTPSKSKTKINPNGQTTAQPASKPAKAVDSGAQPLPGSKSVMPPNSTEADKNKSGN